MFIYDCAVTFDKDILMFDNCQFKFVSYITQPPLTLAISADSLIEIINKMDEETQLREVRKIYALPIPIKSDSKQEQKQNSLH